MMPAAGSPLPRVVDVPGFRPSQCAILNGGLKKWRAEGRPVESGEARPKPGTFKATLRPERVRSMQQLIANLESVPSR